jgi:hypothetical protein
MLPPWEQLKKDALLMTLIMTFTSEATITMRLLAYKSVTEDCLSGLTKLRFAVGLIVKR